MTPILGLDPGYERSALVRLVGGVPAGHWHVANDDLEWMLAHDHPSGFVLVIEQIESYGMAVGKEVFETVYWSGRFAATFDGPMVRIPRRAVKLALCHSAKANDSNIRAALIDHFGPGREKAIGTKKQPGPLHGITGDLLAATAVGLTYLLQHGEVTA